MRFQPLSRPPGEFQQPPSAAEVATLAVRILGSDTILADATELGGGAFNNAFRLTATDGRRWVLRLSPPRDHPLVFHVERGLLHRERALTPWLTAVAPLLAREAGADFTGEICPRDTVVNEFLEGENWDAARASLTPEEDEALWRELAGLLLRIHATPAPFFGYPEPEPRHARWSDFMLDSIRGLAGDLARLGEPDAEARAWLAVAERCAPALDEIREPRVLHGDPWPKNVLIQRDAADGGAPRIVALLDHERGGFGDPLQEWVFNGWDFPPVFWEAYGARPDDLGARIRAAVYRGMIDIQCLLEKPRYGCDATEPRRRLANGADALRRLLAESA